MIASVKFFKSLSARNLFWYGCAFMGFVFIYNPIGGTSADSSSIAQGLTDMHINPVNFEKVSSYFFTEEGSLDIYQELIVFIVSVFTGNAHVLFLVFSIIYGFFYSRNLWIVLDIFEEKNVPWWIWIVIIMFILLNPIWDINGGRMWVALHVFLYGILNFYMKDDKIKIIWSLISVFIHFSFIFPVVLFIIYQFLHKKNLTIFFILYFVAITFSEINIQSLKDSLIEILPSQLSRKTESYMDEDHVQNVIEYYDNFSLYLIIAEKMAKYFILIILLFFWVNLKKIFQDEISRHLLSLFLFFAAIFEMFSVIPSFGRFLVLSNMIFYTLLLVLLFNKNKANIDLRNIVKYLSPLLVLPILLSLRIGCNYYGLSLFWGNFISAIFIDDKANLIDLIKKIFI